MTTPQSGGTVNQTDLQAVAEIYALMEMSAGVAGLRLDGQVMPWAEVRRLYLPTWFASHDAPHSGRTP